MRPVAVVLALSCAALLGGCTDFEEGPARNQVGIIRVDVAAPVVTAGTVQLDVQVTLDNVAARSGQLNLTVKAFDTTTGMLVATVPRPVGEMPKDRSKTVSIPVTVSRDASYRIEVLLHQDDRLVQRAQVQASNLRNLEPTEYDTGLRIDAIDVQVQDVKDGRATLRCPVYLTNEAGAASRALRLQVKAREVSTGLIADEEWVDVASIGPDRTRPVNVVLQVPDDFNYELQAFLWDGDVIVERGTGRVQLLPTYTEPQGQRVTVTNPDISLFREPGGDYLFDGSRPRADPGYQDTDEEGATPGPSLALLGLALAVAAIAFRRRTA
ncbi:MAG TPA: hypothetical protein VFH47_04675 [Candidatus Thermoplasmatota archaeon]|nr:hypothetical protein [Candidatus Thermoplasmatota archaeon]